MRLRIYTIPSLLWFAIGLLPVWFWCAFHSDALIYRKEEGAWVASFGFLTALIFAFLMRRGVFTARFLVLLASFTILLFEIWGAVTGRDFMTLGGAITGVGVLIAITLWLERTMGSASINPECPWFEGNPRVLTQIAAEVYSGSSMSQARVRRIDSQGLFLMLDSTISFKPKGMIRVKLQWGAQEIEGECRITASFNGDRPGLGLQFLPKDLYHFSQYTALVQQLRGKGL